jgi:hypothetical protein
MATVQQRILDDLVLALEAIDGTGSYATTISRVYIMDASEIQGPQTPCIFLLSDTDRVTHQRLGMNVRKLDLTLVLAMSGGEAGWDARLRAFASDVERALAVDDTRGGLALDTLFEESFVFEGADEAPIVQAEAKVAVIYRTAYGDPDSPL